MCWLSHITTQVRNALLGEGVLVVTWDTQACEELWTEGVVKCTKYVLVEGAAVTIDVTALFHHRMTGGSGAQHAWVEHVPM